MARFRRFGRKRRRLGRRRFRRRFRRGRFPRALRKYYKPLTVKLGFTGSSIDINTAAVAFSRTFILSEYPDYAAYVGVWDQFRIVGVKWKLVPNFNVNTGRTYFDANTATVVDKENVTPVCATCIDNNDASVPGSLDFVLAYNNCRVQQANRPIKRYLKPTVLTQMWENIANTSYHPKKRCWIDSADFNTEHFGLKGIITFNSNPGSLTNCDHAFFEYITLYVQFKNRQ